MSTAGAPGSESAGAVLPYTFLEDTDMEEALMKKSVWLLLATGAVLASLALAACGGDDGYNGGGSRAPAATTAGGGEQTPAVTPGDGNDVTPPPGGGGTKVDIRTENFAFVPREVTVPAGEPVTFEFSNGDSVPHTFTLYLDEGFTQALSGGSATEANPEITVAFVDPGKYYFRCEVHPSRMRGELTAR